MAPRTVCAHQPDVEIRTLGCHRCHEQIALTWVQLQAGEPCRGCGVPYRRTPWRGVGRASLTARELSLLIAEERRYNEQHGHCGGFVQRVADNLEMHCSMCCPPPPLHPTTQRNIVDMLKAFGVIDGTVRP